MKHITVIKDKNEKLCNLITANNQYEVNCRTTCGIDKCTTKHVVYKITCMLCNEFYIGMTNNTICIRYNQHKKSIIKGEKSNPIIEHFNKSHPNNQCNWSRIKFEIIKKCQNSRLTAIEESLLIDRLKPRINRKHKYSIFNFME